MTKRGRPQKKAPQTVEEWLRMYPGRLNGVIPFCVRQAEEIHKILLILCEKDLFARVGATGWEAYFVKPPRWGSFLSYFTRIAQGDDRAAEFDINAALRQKNDFPERVRKDFIEAGTKELNTAKSSPIDIEETQDRKSVV